MHSPSLQILIIHDDKPGHISQLEGLKKALDLLINVQWTYLQTKAEQPALDENFSPNIIIGAGHSTHTAILRLSKKYKAFSVVLMKPSLPNYFFDAIICPGHDKIKDSKRVFKTKGTINKVRPVTNARLNKSYHLILLGGPSKNYEWEENKLIEQISHLCQTSTKIKWLLIPSRRTPSSMSDKIEQAQIGNLELCPPEALHSPLDELLLQSCMTWVTPDSQSMLYESITSGAPTGIFSLTPIKRKKSVRIERQTKQLIESELIMSFKEWKAIQSSTSINETALVYPPSPTHFCEADKAARWMLERYTLTKSGRSPLDNEDEIEP